MTMHKDLVTVLQPACPGNETPHSKISENVNSTGGLLDDQSANNVVILPSISSAVQLKLHHTSIPQGLIT